MNEHTCKKSTTCCCDITALEPDEQCPVHGHPWPPTCEICGKFMKWPKFEEEPDNNFSDGNPADYGD